jgi:hypothetical protein
MKIELSLIVEGEGKIILEGNTDRNFLDDINWTNTRGDQNLIEKYVAHTNISRILSRIEENLIDITNKEFRDKNYSIMLNVKKYE